MAYPITKNPSTANPWLANIDKALSSADMPLVMSSGSDQSSWLKSVRHDVTLGSRGVMCDVKKGGLRRDFSLAFEMDGTAESPNTTNFNTQNTEFVGNGDTYSAPSKPAGMPVNERFLWRDLNGAGNTFPYSITASNNRSVPRLLRGPNWWALRDYANLYKRLTGTGGVYTLAARSYFPNRSSESANNTLSDYLDPYGNGETWDVETGTGTTPNKYLYRPARANYAPVNLGSSVLVSLLAKNVIGVFPNQRADLAVGLDPLFYF